MKADEDMKVNEEEIIKWRQNLERREDDNRQLENMMDLENIYDGMIFIRRWSRLCLQFGLVWLIIGFFYGDILQLQKIINEILKQNESQDYLKFKVYCKGSLEQQSSNSKEFIIKGEIIDQGIANLYIQNPYPNNMNNLNILCSIDPECIIVFAQQELYVQDHFNVTCEKSARMQMNIRNIQTNKFTFLSDSSGTLFINHIITNEGYIAMSNGELIIQSTKSFQLNYFSQSHVVCVKGFQLIDQIQENCYIQESQNNTILNKICKGQISICEKNSCDIQQKFQVTGNQTTIYANIFFDIGKPFIIENDDIQIFSTQVFKQQIDFDDDSLIKIQQFMNTSGSADIAEVIYYNIHILLIGQFLVILLMQIFNHGDYQHFQWIFESNSFISICFYQTRFLSMESCFNFKIKNLNIKFNKIINNYFGLTYLQYKEKGKFENWLILNEIANTVIYEYLKYDNNFIAAMILSLISSLIFSVICIYILIEILKGLEVYVLNQCSQYHHYSATTTGDIPNKTVNIVKDIINKLQQQPDNRDSPSIMSIFTYIFYLFAQNQFNSSITPFIKTLFRWSNQEETELYYANELDDIYLSMDQEEVKEKYEQFCYLNQLTIESLTQVEYCFSFYGFELAEKQNIQGLSKIKLNPEAKSYQQLNQEDKLSKNSLEIFLQTQCFLTGIPADTWAYAFFIVLICYTILVVIYQILQYWDKQYPDEISYMMEQQRMKKGSFFIILYQWYIFLLLAFCVFFYFGLIIVWLLLGSIINPNFYLVYSSSALSLVAFITAQLNQIKLNQTNL
ncbi:unnamed protein product [Paramecium sonneborni]|uniref:Transmembrane protein n=1 Tax=Paramecium sonneborni TaxID=65129 RepID=A0A8S1R4I5_9CILI|nr:unnamed protein product [Paramecium sonneborni]